MTLRTSTFLTVTLFGLFHASVVTAAERFPGAGWERAEPEGAVWSKQKLDRELVTADRLDRGDDCSPSGRSLRPGATPLRRRSLPRCARAS